MLRVNPSRARTAPYTRVRSSSSTADPRPGRGGHAAAPGFVTSARPRRPRRVSSDRSRQQREAEQQHRQRRRHRRRAVGLADRHDLHLQRLEAAQRGDGVLAEHHGDRDERGRQNPRPDVGHHHTQDGGRPARAQRPRGLRKCLQVNRRQRTVEGAVRERQHDDDVDERQGERRLTEQVRHPQVDVAQPDDDHQRGNRQRQQAQELDETPGPGCPQPHPDHRGHQDHEHQEHGEHREQQRHHDRADTARRRPPGSSRPPGCDRCPAGCGC